jgi:hypothetical protein
MPTRKPELFMWAASSNTSGPRILLSRESLIITGQYIRLQITSEYPANLNPLFGYATIGEGGNARCDRQTTCQHYPFVLRKWRYHAHLPGVQSSSLNRFPGRDRDRMVQTPMPTATFDPWVILLRTVPPIRRNVR